ncbi:hypothetical protein JOQ06_014418, partial [Pogonophryne albipinna]
KNGVARRKTKGQEAGGERRSVAAGQDLHCSVFRLVPRLSMNFNAALPHRADPSYISTKKKMNKRCWEVTTAMKR